MKKLALLLILLPHFVLSQTTQRHSVYAVYDGDKLLKVYSSAEDCVRFVSRSKSTLNYKDTYVYFTPDSTQWYKPCNDTFDDVFQPEPLEDKYLAKDSIYVVKQKHFYFADRAYLSLEECKIYADNWKETYVKVPYFYRDEDSCKLAVNRRNKRLKK